MNNETAWFDEVSMDNLLRESVVHLVINRNEIQMQIDIFVTLIVISMNNQFI